MDTMKTQVVKTKKDFIQLLREEFIPYMNKCGLNDFIINNQKEMFTTWNIFFYEDKIVKLEL